MLQALSLSLSSFWKMKFIEIATRNISFQRCQLQNLSPIIRVNISSKFSVELLLCYKHDVCLFLDLRHDGT